jgi:hypothetical protein
MVGGLWRTLRGRLLDEKLRRLWKGLLEWLWSGMWSRLRRVLVGRLEWPSGDQALVHRVDESEFGHGVIVYPTVHFRSKA